MTLNLANQYYLKASENFEFNLEEAIEHLNYALSYDQEHAGANYLMGRVHEEHFLNFREAEECYIKSLAADEESLLTCESYAGLLIRLQRHEEALKLLGYAMRLPGARTSVFRALEALVYEQRQEFEKAKQVLRQAKLESYSSENLQFLKEEMERIEEKERLASSVHFVYEM